MSDLSKQQLEEAKGIVLLETPFAKIMNQPAFSNLSPKEMVTLFINTADFAENGGETWKGMLRLKAFNLGCSHVLGIKTSAVFTEVAESSSHNYLIVSGEACKENK